MQRTNRIFLFITVFTFVLGLHSNLLAKKEKDEVPAEYAELLTIVESEETLLKRLKSKVPEEKLVTEVEHRLQTIKKDYQSYIEKYPDSVFAKILYAKFLRKSNETKDANEVFLSIHEDNPDIAVVNQQLALYASETGKFRPAYEFFNRALELDPNQALFHYQYGEFLYTYKTVLMQNYLMTVSDIEDTMVSSFEKAHQLSPGTRDFQVRWAESYFDKFNPNWKEVLKIWDDLLSTSQNQFERDVLILQKVRVLIELKEYYEAEQLLKRVTDPSLQKSRRQLLEKLP